MTSDGDEDAAIAQLWRQAGGTAAARPPLEVSGPEHVLPSAFAVTTLATAAVSLATLAAAELHAARTGTAARAVHVDRSHAALAFRRELYATPVGWEMPPLWDPIAGDYATRDGWIRLHTNYAHHRDPVLRVLGVRPERDAVAAAVAKRGGDTLEQEVVGAGGCAAAMRDLDAWRAHAQGRAVATEPLLACDAAEAPPWRPAAAPLPLAGVRVLDLTRVIAGPICTSFLAGWGADVLRVDPPGFADVPALLPETTAGKRRTFLDLRAPAGRATTVRASLARTAALLVSLGESPDPHTPQPNAGDVARWLEEVPTHWGALRRVRQPGAIAGLEVVRGRSPGPLGSDRAIWSDA